MPKTHIIWGDGFVRVSPQYPPALTEALKYYQRYREQEGYRAVYKGRYRECFQAHTGIAENNQIEQCLITFPGFMHRVKQVLTDAGWEYDVVDTRTPFPEPDWEAALGGLRDYQCECAYRSIMSGGGVIACPTGWGKTHIIASIIRAFPHRELCNRNAPLVVLAAPDVDICRQNRIRIQEMLPERDVGLVCGSSHQFNDDIQIVTLDSLHKLPLEEASIVIVDEVHQAASETRAEQLARATKAHIWGASATPVGRYDGSDLVTEGIVGPIVYQRSYQEGVADGALVPITVFWIEAPQPEIGLSAYLRFKSRKGKYDNGMEKDENFRDMLVTLMRMIPETMQTLCIMQHTAQMDSYVEHLPGVPCVHATTSAKKLREQRQYFLAAVKPKERKALYAHIRDGSIRKAMSTYVYKQGVDFPELQIMINAGGGGSQIVHGQIPGRGSRPSAGKDMAYMIDFWHPWDMVQSTDTKTGAITNKPGPLHRDDRARDKVYRKLGFDRHWLSSINELPFLGGAPIPVQGQLL